MVNGYFPFCLLCHVRTVVGSLSNSGYCLCVRHSCPGPCDNSVLAHGVVVWGRPTQWSRSTFVKSRSGRFLCLQHSTRRWCFSPALSAHTSSMTTASRSQLPQRVAGSSGAGQWWEYKNSDVCYGTVNCGDEFHISHSLSPCGRVGIGVGSVNCPCAPQAVLAANALASAQGAPIKGASAAFCCQTSTPSTT